MIKAQIKWKDNLQIFKNNRCKSYWISKYNPLDGKVLSTHISNFKLQTSNPRGWLKVTILGMFKYVEMVFWNVKCICEASCHWSDGDQRCVVEGSSNSFLSCSFTPNTLTSQNICISRFVTITLNIIIKSNSLVNNQFG